MRIAVINLAVISLDVCVHPVLRLAVRLAQLLF